MKSTLIICRYRYFEYYCLFVKNIFFNFCHSENKFSISSCCYNNFIKHFMKLSILHFDLIAFGIFLAHKIFDPCWQNCKCILTAASGQFIIYIGLNFLTNITKRPTMPLCLSSSIGGFGSLAKSLRKFCVPSN